MDGYRTLRKLLEGRPGRERNKGRPT